jgi:phosphatidate cytidylyltransferase
MTAEAPKAETPKSPTFRDQRSPATPGLRALLGRLRSRLTDLGPRVASSLILIVTAVATLHLGSTIFVLVWLAATLRIHLEWQRLIGGEKPYRRLLVGALALVLAAALAGSHLPLAVLVIVCAALVAGIGDPAGFRLWAAAGVVYAGSLIISLCMLRLSFPLGVRAIAWLFAVVWGTDVVAYFAGRLIGGPKFMPRISPSKTWSGTLTGIFGGACLGTLFLAIMAGATGTLNPAPLAVFFVLGFITAAVAQAGDLFESWTKRQFGAKDSGGLIPGHGGLMDRLDGFIAAAVLIALLAAATGVPAGAEGPFNWI